MKNIDRKHALYKQVSIVGKSLGHSLRLEILELLSQGPQCVEKMAHLLSCNVKTISAQLRVLSDAGLVTHEPRGRLLLIDVRDHDEYEAGHLPGAVNMPFPELDANIHDLPEAIELAAYCRGALCFKAREAAKRFAWRGRQLQIVVDGIMEWVGEGRPIEKKSSSEQ